MDAVGEELDFFMAGLLMKSEEFDATFLRELIQNGQETSFALLEVLCSKTVKVRCFVLFTWLSNHFLPNLKLCLYFTFRNCVVSLYRK